MLTMQKTFKTPEDLVKSFITIYEKTINQDYQIEDYFNPTDITSLIIKSDKEDCKDSKTKELPHYRN